MNEEIFLDLLRSHLLALLDGDIKQPDRDDDRAETINSYSLKLPDLSSHPCRDCPEGMEW